MTWMEYFMLGVAVAYVGISISYAWRGEWPWVLLYLGYAMANTAVAWAAVAGRAAQ